MKRITSSGKELWWNCQVREDDTLYIEYGQIGGKMQARIKKIDAGKNIGKRNETSVAQQAQQEAATLIAKMKDKGYFVVEDEVDTSNIVPFPMLAIDYKKIAASNIPIPCCVQPKIDGVRCIVVPGVGLFSRLRKPFRTIAHVWTEVSKLDPTVVYDGELYSPYLTFEELVSAIKSGCSDDRINYFVYDIIVDNVPYLARKERLDTIMSGSTGSSFAHIIKVPTGMCSDANQIDVYHSSFLDDGYEGTIIRDPTALYNHGRSGTALVKYKNFVDAEFEIVGYREGTGRDASCVIWLCAGSGGDFWCKPQGTIAERQRAYQDAPRLVGKMLTVRYQELSSKGTPRFPCGIAIRDYE